MTLRYRIISRNDDGWELENFIINDRERAEVIGKLFTFLFKDVGDVRVECIDDDGDVVYDLNIG
jgi:hypothetical protein